MQPVQAQYPSRSELPSRSPVAEAERTTTQQTDVASFAGTELTIDRPEEHTKAHLGSVRVSHAQFPIEYSFFHRLEAARLSDVALDEDESASPSDRLRR